MKEQQQAKMNQSAEKVVVKGNQIWAYDSKSQLILYGGIGEDTPFSNFHHIKNGFRWRGRVWFNVESAIMYEKAKFFKDDVTARKVSISTNPFQAKKLGRQVKNFDDSLWLARITKVLPAILWRKYLSDPNLKKWLLHTGNARLAEIGKENEKRLLIYKDRRWGLALGVSNPDLLDPEKWSKYGDNLLGKSTEKVRNLLLKISKD